MKTITKEDTVKFFEETFIPEIYKETFIKKEFMKELREFTENLYDISKKSITPLTEKETLILRRTQGIYTKGKKETYEQIGEKYEVTRARIDQIITKIKTHVIEYILEQKKKNNVLNMNVKKIISEKELRKHDLNTEITIKELMYLRKENINLYNLATKVQKLVKVYYGYNLTYVGINFPYIVNKSLSDFVKNEDIFLSLRRKRIFTIVDLISMTRDEIKKILRNNSKIIINKVHETGLLFADEVSINNIYNPIDIDIFQLKLPSRIQNALKRAGINTLHDIIKNKIEDLYHIRGLGNLCVSEIIEMVNNLGLQFSEDHTEEYKNESEAKPEKTTEINYLTDIKELNFSDTITNALINANILYLHQLLSTEISKLMRKKDIREEIETIIHRVHELGYKFENENEEILKKIQEMQILKEELIELEKIQEEYIAKQREIEIKINRKQKRIENLQSNLSQVKHKKY